MTADLSPIGPERPSLTSEVRLRLKQAIVSGQLAPGSLHSVAELASALGVSRTPVREALIELASQSMVKFERNRGIRILRTSLHDLEEVFTLRLLLEVPAAREAARRAGPEAHRALSRALAQMERTARSDDEARFMDHDRLLHRTLLEAAGNMRLAAYVDSLRDLVLSKGASTAHVSRSLQDIVAEHTGIVDAVVRKDPEAAAAAMRAHVINTGRLLIAQEGGDPAEATFVWRSSECSDSRGEIH